MIGGCYENWRFVESRRFETFEHTAAGGVCAQDDLDPPLLREITPFGIRVEEFGGVDVDEDPVESLPV